MGRSSEEFIKQRQQEIDSLPTNFSNLINEPAYWLDYFKELGNNYINQYTKNEKQNI